MKKLLIALATTVALVGPAAADQLRDQGLDILKRRADPHNLLNADPSELLTTFEATSWKNRVVILAAMWVHNQRCQHDVNRAENIRVMIATTNDDKTLELVRKKIAEFEAIKTADFCPTMTDALASVTLTVRWDCPPPEYWGQWISCYPILRGK